MLHLKAHKLNAMDETLAIFLATKKHLPQNDKKNTKSKTSTWHYNSERSQIKSLILLFYCFIQLQGTHIHHSTPTFSFFFFSFSLLYVNFVLSSPKIPSITLSSFLSSHVIIFHHNTLSTHIFLCRMKNGGFECSIRSSEKW